MYLLVVVNRIRVYPTGDVILNSTSILTMNLQHNGNLKDVLHTYSHVETDVDGNNQSVLRCSIRCKAEISATYARRTNSKTVN